MIKRTALGTLVGAQLALGVPPAAAQAQAAATDANASSDRIVVTARKREETMQEVPLAVSAFGSLALERQQVSNLADLSLAVPNMLVTQTGGSANAAQIFIRGFGQDALAYVSESPIGIYFDDVYLGRVQGSLLDLMDIERIEVLRGPQGTLYGRNSTTGAVKFVLKRPSLTTPRLVAEATAGSFSRRDFRASGSVPLVAGSVALKFDAVAKRNDGYMEAVDANGQPTGARGHGADRQIARLGLAWQVADSTTLDLAVDASRDHSGPLNSTPYRCTANTADCTPLFGSPYKTMFKFDGQRSRTSGASAKLTTQLPWAEFKSITAYRRISALDPIDLLPAPGFTLPILYDQKQHQTTQEFQLTSNTGGPLGWVAGLFYFREWWRTDSNFLNARRNVDEQTATSLALYGEANYKLTTQLGATLGVRVTHDRKNIQRDIYAPRTAALPTVSATPPEIDSKVTTPKLALDYAVSRDWLLFGSWSRGYRPAAYSEAWPGTAGAAAGIAEPEKVTSFDVGSKTSWDQGRATLNLAAYRMQYRNLQSGQLGGGSFTIASSDVDVSGVEAEFSLRPVNALRLYGNAGLLRDKFKRTNIPNFDLGKRLRYAPRESYKLGAEYTMPAAGLGSFTLGGNLTHAGTTPQDRDNTPGITMPAYTLYDAQLAFDDASGRWRVTLAGRNLGDKAYWRSGVNDFLGIGTISRFYAAPRTWSLSVRATF